MESGRARLAVLGSNSFGWKRFERGVLGGAEAQKKGLVVENCLQARLILPGRLEAFHFGAMSEMSPI